MRVSNRYYVPNVEDYWIQMLHSPHSSFINGIPTSDQVKGQLRNLEGKRVETFAPGNPDIVPLNKLLEAAGITTE